MREPDKEQGLYIRPRYEWKPDGPHRMFKTNTGRGATVLGHYDDREEAEAALLYAKDLDQGFDPRTGIVLNIGMIGALLFCGAFWAGVAFFT